MKQRHKHLRRLEPAYYCGQANVHWILTIRNRRTGWLTPVFYYRFRELLAHTTFRYSIACPIYCLMPDHIHMLWIGISDGANQCNAMKYFRKLMGELLQEVGFELQHQSFDHVLQCDERKDEAFHELVEYIAHNPERKGLVPTGKPELYGYTGCLVPGYPELEPWQPDYWMRFWRTYQFLRKNGLSRVESEE